MVSFYFDEMMPRPVADQLAKGGITVVIAHMVGMKEKDDLAEHLPYATEHGLVLVTCDRKFGNLAAQQSDHGGVICWTGEPNDFGGMVKQ